MLTRLRGMASVQFRQSILTVANRAMIAARKVEWTLRFAQLTCDMICPRCEVRRAMLRELILSVVSGIIVAVILQAFRFGRPRREAGPRQSMSYHAVSERRGGGFFGGLVRFALAMAGGIALAYSVAPFVLRRRYRDFGGDGFDGFDGFDGLAAAAPMLILTVFATIIVWALLSALTQR
jgi:hypothetical protein